MLKITEEHYVLIQCTLCQSRQLRAAAQVLTVLCLQRADVQESEDVTLRAFSKVFLLT